MIQKNRVNGKVHTNVPGPTSVVYRVNWKLILTLTIGVGLGVLLSFVYFSSEFGKISAQFNRINTRLDHIEQTAPRLLQDLR